MAKKKKSAVAPPQPVRKAPPRPKDTGPSPKAQERAAVQQQLRREGTRRKLVAIGLATAAVAAVAGYLVAGRRADAALDKALTSGSCTTDDRTDPKGGGSGHVQAPVYSVDPPSGGNHLATAARAGVYSGSNVPTDGLLVHSMEHGYVVVFHQPNLPAADLSALADFQESRLGDVIVAERQSLTAKVAATAWGQRLLCGAVEPDALDRFAEEYVGKGPEDVERG